MLGNKISIVLTTFNRSHFVIEMLHSIINQTYIDWECFIIDDNSVDDTVDVVNEFIKNDNRFTLIIKPKTILKGLPASRNIGINKSEGDYLVFFDDDDVIHPQLLELCIKEFNQDPNIDFVHYKKQSFENDFDYSRLTTTLNVYSKKLSSNLYEDVISGNLALASCTVLWKAKILKENLFIETLMYAEEWECYSRILIQNDLAGIKINEPLYFNRKHPKSNTGEFWNNDPIRVNSHKEAIRLVVANLNTHKKISPRLMNHLLGLAISYRDKELLRCILPKSKESYTKRLFFKFKYLLFPVWVKYKRATKK